MENKAILKRIGEIIRIARLQNNLSLVELARKIGFQPGAIHFWEKGLRNPNAIAMKRIENVLGINIDLKKLEREVSNDQTTNDQTCSLDGEKDESEEKQYHDVRCTEEIRGIESRE